MDCTPASRLQSIEGHVAVIGRVIRSENKLDFHHLSLPTTWKLGTPNCTPTHTQFLAQSKIHVQYFDSQKTLKLQSFLGICWGFISGPLRIPKFVAAQIPDIKLYKAADSQPSAFVHLQPQINNNVSLST